MNTQTTTGELTRWQWGILTAATIPMLAFGALGGVGTYTNIRAVFGRSATALGVVAAGEGATLVLALVYVGLTLLGQSSPGAVRLGLWALPGLASGTGAVVATGLRDSVVYAVTPVAMCVAAEGVGLLARRVVVYRTGVDMEAQRRNASTMRRLAYQRARAANHPWRWTRRVAELASWRLARHVGTGDTDLGTGLITVQRERVTAGADAALAAMYGAAHQAADLTVGGTAGTHHDTQVSRIEGAPAETPTLPFGTPRDTPARPRKQPPPSSPAGPIGEPVDDVEALFAHAHAPVVYYLRNGDRVKIGVSQNIKRRVATLSLRPSDVVRVEHGHQEHERAQHVRFADLRASNTEWFELRGPLAEYLGVDELADRVSCGITLADLAAVAGVPTPTPSSNLTDEQLDVVLRWFRYREYPPLSYRQAMRAYRDAGFTGSEERVRRAWNALMSNEEAGGEPQTAHER